jgi:hypothetical protein
MLYLSFFSEMLSHHLIATAKAQKKRDIHWPKQIIFRPKGGTGRTTAPRKCATDGYHQGISQDIFTSEEILKRA